MPVVGGNIERKVGCSFESLWKSIVTYIDVALVASLRH